MSPKIGPVSLEDSKTHAWLTHWSIGTRFSMTVDLGLLIGTRFGISVHAAYLHIGIHVLR